MQKNLRAPRGNKLICKNWQSEAALRMLLNNLDPEVAEDPDNLIVYGGSGKAARNWECFERIVATLKELESDQTLLIQSGKPVGVFKTHQDAPRVLLANSNLVPKWADFETFSALEKKGLTMFGQMTAESWIYIGTQGILQGTYETFMAAAEKHFKSDLRGRVILSAGLGGMGGAQPLAATMAGAVFLGVEVQQSRIEKRLATGYLDRASVNLEEALALCEKAKSNRQAISIGLLGNIVDVLPKLLNRGWLPDLLTDQTSAHDPLIGYFPNDLSLRKRLRATKNNPQQYIDRARASMVVHCQSMVEMQRRGVTVFDYGNNPRGQALLAGFKDAFSYPGFVPEYIRPLFCRGEGPFRWVALSGEAEDIAVTDQALKEAFPHKKNMLNWLEMAGKMVKFQGLPARICWLGYGERDRAGVIFNQLVRSGKVRAPIVIGRDHLDCGSVASPNRESEAMKDGSDAIADWPILNAMLNVASGATWVSLHHGGGVGIGYSLHAGQVIVADGSLEAEERLKRVLTNDPGMGVIRHADAGYEEALEVAKNMKVNIPMRT